MELMLSNPFVYLDAFLLIFVRIISLFISIPIFSNRNIPVIAKIGLSLFISAIVINAVEISITVSSEQAIPYLFTIIKEFITGWIIGYSVYMVFSIVILAGQFIDQQIGFSMVNVFDPLSQIQLSITGNLYYYLLMLVGLLSNVHHVFIRAIIKSFEYIPIGHFKITDELFDVFTGFYTDLIILALKIAAPFFLAMLVTNVALGILARTAPQLNLFVIGFPVKILLGLIVLLITTSVFSSVSTIIFDKVIAFLDTMIKGLMPK